MLLALASNARNREVESVVRNVPVNSPQVEPPLSACSITEKGMDEVTVNRTFLQRKESSNGKAAIRKSRPEA